ncbi:hypothetical protein GP486_002505 [Trichoglossum hirsutum]|uniref:UBC core domain-containing protein n=1 Tax=Trichoglossum hirsutum TaxID=265104 RepID=A0A9P8LEV7_9PEZI|nr:hypothetical protein GP486_002505 [Trichoglossum hirsutum]
MYAPAVLRLFSSVLRPCLVHFPPTDPGSKIEDSGSPVPPLYALSYDEGIGSPELAKFKRTGIPPRNYVLVAFCELAHGFALFNESKFALLDRYLYFGQFVKRNTTDAMSGTITRLWTELTLRPSFPGLMSGDFLPSTPPVGRQSVSKPSIASWLTDDGTSAAEIGEHVLDGIPAEEVDWTHEFVEGDFVVYNSWLGSVEDVVVEVTVRLGDGSVVAVEDSTKLEIPILARSIRRPSGTIAGTSVLNVYRQKTVPADHVSVGQYVVTSRGNLRRGSWKYGSYEPSVAPQGYVVDVRTTSIEVFWLGQNPMVPGKFIPIHQPPTELKSDILDSGQIRRYDSGRKPRAPKGVELPGLAHRPDIQSGDTVRFRDLAGAVMKYDGSTRVADGRSCGTVVKIPETMSQGYDVNTFVVAKTKTFVSVLWQDLTETKENGVTLLPYQNTDDHDVWPGEIVAIKEDTKNGFTEGEQTECSSREDDSQTLRPKKVGVVQSVNSLERMAKVKWYIKPEIEMIGKPFAFLTLPGSKLGELSDTIEDVSLYELLADPSLTINRGDFVLIAPPLDFPEAPTNDRPSGLSSYMEGVVTGSSTYQAEVASSGANDPPRLLQSPGSAGICAVESDSGHNFGHPGERTDLAFSRDGPVDWFGEVVDLRLDGFVAVRLGASDEVKDIVVNVERLSVLERSEGGGDTEGDEGSSTDYVDLLWSSRDSEESNSEDAIEEIEYEGGHRWDSDGGDEVWATETEDEEVEGTSVTMTGGGNDPISPAISRSDTDEDPVASTRQGAGSQLPDALSGGLTETQAVNTPEARPLDPHQDHPARFAVLDSDPPADHAFIGKYIDSLTGGARRIRKEHKILETSLPNGIFVRTWESRIDLLRVLIIGPRNTPYELAPFVLDFHFGSTFPATPPLAYFHSWTNGTGRVNPNLYEDGKICLSLLGTWPGQSKNEAWSSTRSSMLQVLVSLMGLVLVKEPFYISFKHGIVNPTSECDLYLYRARYLLTNNLLIGASIDEAGFDVLMGAKEAVINSALYTEKAFVLARGFVEHVLIHPVQGLENVIRFLYWPDQDGGSNLLQEVIQQCNDIVRRTEDKQAVRNIPLTSDDGGVMRLSAGALVLLKRTLTALEEIMAKLKSPISADCKGRITF